MVNRSGASIAALVIVYLLTVSGLVWSAGKPKTLQSDKISQVMAAMDKAQTLSEVSQVVKAANLTEQEYKQLASKIKSGPLFQKMETFRKQSLASSKIKLVKNKPGPGQLLQQKRLVLKNAHADMIKKSNKAIIKLKPARIAKTAPPTVPLPHTTVSAETLARLTSETGQGSNSRINDCTAPRVGEEITIRGTGFGNTEGRVALILRRELYYFSVTSWNNTRIVCTVTNELEQPVGDALDGVEALLWVKLHGGETGPTLETRIMPNLELITPVIDSITPTEISPGQSFIIRGRNLVKYRYDRASVKFLFGNDISVQATVEDSDHEFIQAKIPDDYGGMQRKVCRLEVTNDLRRSTDQTVTFIPVEEIMEIRTPGHITAASQPPFPIFLSVIGDTNRATVHDIILKNGWVVEDCVLDVNAHGVNAGAYYVEEPEHGSTLARAVIEAWADAYSYVTAIDTLYIKGPRGVPYK